MLKFAKLHESAIAPERFDPEAAGYDLATPVSCVVLAISATLINIQLQFQFPPGTYGRIAPRSGFSLDNFTNIGGGVVDPGFRGPVGVIIQNHSHRDIHLLRGDRIAQIICEKYTSVELEQVEPLPFTSTARGASGFGSTGLNK